MVLIPTKLGKTKHNLHTITKYMRKYEEHTKDKERTRKRELTCFGLRSLLP